MAEPAVLAGLVVSGRRRGRTLGFPTANLELPTAATQALAGGVYAAWVRWQAEPWRAAVTNIGARPTFAEGGCLVEVHVLDFDGDLYGRSLEVTLVERLRPECRFADAGALVQQVSKDIDQARAVLAGDARRP